MSKRTTHLFQFTGAQIAAAATAEAAYHEARAIRWETQYEAAIAEARKQGVQVREYDVTGGKRADVVIDPSVQTRLNESMSKRTRHQASRDTFRMEAAAYGTQPERMYELDTEDVLHFRLAGGARDE